jgi:hypothetical protein
MEQAINSSNVRRETRGSREVIKTGHNNKDHKGQDRRSNKDLRGRETRF